MPSYKDFDLYVYSADIDLLEELKDLELSGGEWEQAIFDDYTYYTNFCEWDNWEEQLTKISMKYPNILFKLYVLNTEEERYRVYFKNGNNHKDQAKVVKVIHYDSYDPSNL